MARRTHAQAGFTLVELLIGIGIIAVLMGLAFVNLGQTQTSSKQTNTAETLISDLKSQQLLAMAGDVGSTTSQQPHGILIQSNQYTMFASASYSAGDTNNYTVSTPANTSLSTTFPGSTVLFKKGDGSVSGYTAGSNTITVTTGTTNTVITVTRFGATAVN